MTPEQWGATLASGIDQHGSDPDLQALLAVDDPGTEDLLLAPVEPGDLALINDLVLGGPKRTVAALAVRINWSPTATGESSLAWVFALVVKSNVFTGPHDAFCAVKREEDERWTVIAVEQLPWFLASTAGGLRAALEHGRPMVLKEVRDPRLLDRVAASNPPAVDEKGRI